ncbi:hypothetical protein [Microbacterium istanbulense]|uniref:Uncharacterized protein n=1 Tax=Microbacterium istanbulense TaxID=3122049 RepID=A0ABU8LMC6_9MICO
MITRRRSALFALPLLAAALLTAGCTAQPASPSPTSTASTSPDEPDTPDAQDVEAAWIDGGRGFAVVTWGSSTCLPLVENISAEGQTVSVILADPDTATACAKDLVPRAASVGLPSGVDPAKDVELKVTYGDLVADTDLDGLSDPADPESETDYAPSAGWFDDQGIVLLTWGSSGCPPQLEKIDQTATTATATFFTTDQVCTMDMAPRLTILGMPSEHEGDTPLELVLTGGGLDATLSVLG